jgi:hypothetical protein
MSGAAIGLIVVIAGAAYYVISRGKRSHATGAFRNKPTRDAGGALFSDGGDRDPDAGDAGDAGGDGGAGDGGGGDGGGE